jgi:acyl-CoA synthetase (AMP-forming)/AMP-acid ligase II
MDGLLQELVSRQAAHHWDDAAIVAGDAVGTYGEVERTSDQFANVLRESGCDRGTRARRRC